MYQPWMRIYNKIVFEEKFVYEKENKENIKNEEPSCN